MCVIIVKPKEGILTRKHLKEAFRVNSHGAGMMFADNGKLFIHKGFFGFRKFYGQYSKYQRQYPNSTFVLHFRIASSGLINVENCHPFQVQKGAGFCHNGIMSSLADKEHSDTYNFVTKVLNKLPTGFWHTDDINKKIQKCATSSNSKFVLMDYTGRYLIYNEGAGHWRAGCWYSNASYTITSYTYPQFGTTKDTMEESLEEYARTSIKRSHPDPKVIQLNPPNTDNGSACEDVDELMQQAANTALAVVPSARTTCVTRNYTSRPMIGTCFWCRETMPLEMKNKEYFHMGPGVGGIDIHNKCFAELQGMIQLKCLHCGSNINIPQSFMLTNEIHCEFCNTVMDWYESLDQLIDIYEE